MSETYDPRVTPWRSDLAAATLRGALRAERYVEGDAAVIAIGVAQLREAPRADARLVSEALYGEPVTVFETGRDWAWVQLSSDGYVGYVSAAAIAPAASGATHRVGALRTYLYPQADLKSPPVALLSLNSLVTVLGDEGSFARTDRGFVHSAHLMPRDRFAEDFVAVAERFAGTPYLWGGRTSVGIDCSGLVQMALTAAGIACPRDSDMIETAVGTEIGARDRAHGLLRGDLVFWRGHLGLMTDARSILHANAFHMETVVEPLEVVERRNLPLAGPVTSVRRIGHITPNR